MNRNINSRTLTLMTLIFGASVSTLPAAFDVGWFTIDCGGAMNSSGGSFDLSGTSGQHDAGSAMSGGGWELTGGFWTGVVPVLCEGDANGDGNVDPLDAGFILARFGCDTGTGDPDCGAADQNGDGNVDPLDVGYVLARFGECQ